MRPKSVKLALASKLNLMLKNMSLGKKLNNYIKLN